MMNRNFLFIMTVSAVVLFTGARVPAQNRTYDQIMKDIGAAFENLEAVSRARPVSEYDDPSQSGAEEEETESLNEETRASAVEAARNLEGLFEEVEAFWGQLDSRYAMDLARQAREAARVMGAAVRDNELEVARETYLDMDRACENCHFSYRIPTDSGFLIRP
jgi:cytochrome c556